MASWISAVVAPRKCLLTRCHQVKHRAEAEQVCAGIEFFTPRLFRRHVIHGPHRHPGMRERIPRVTGVLTIDPGIGMQQLRQAEIQNLGLKRPAA